MNHSKLKKNLKSANKIPNFNAILVPNYCYTFISLLFYHVLCDFLEERV